MKRVKSDERGQVFAFSAIGMIALLGMSALVLDVGAWFRADRQIQSVADAAALAGAQHLPGDPDAAIALAEDYAAKNGGPTPTEVEVNDTEGPNDTLVVEIEAEVPGVLSQVFGVEVVTIGSRAVARAALPGKVRWVAPIVVNEKHPKLNCDTGEDGKPKPCSGPEHETTLTYFHLKTGGSDKDTAPDGAGSFGFVDFTGEGSGTSELKQQIAEGYDEYIEPGMFTARTGNPFSAVQDDLQLRVGDELLFPIYRKIIGTGSTAEYEIIGFVGFVITSMDLAGSDEILHGYFSTDITWDAIEADSGEPTDYGVRTIVLSE
jgi:hypothetical protein